MKTIVISQPMKGLTNEAIKQNRQKAIVACEALGYAVIDTVIDDKPPEGTTIEGLWYLGKSLEFFSKADAAYFMTGWQDAKGCVIERECCSRYGLMIIDQ